MLLTGLLGADCFGGNKPLSVVLQALVHKIDDVFPVIIHHPPALFQERIIPQAEAIIQALKDKGVRTIGEAIKMMACMKLGLIQVF